MTQHLDDYVIRLSKLATALDEDITIVGPQFRRWFSRTHEGRRTITWREAIRECMVEAEAGAPMPWNVIPK